VSKREIILYGVFIAIIITCGILAIGRHNASGRRIGELESRLDASVGRIDELNRESAEFAREIGDGIDSLKADIGSGAGSLADRLRSIGKKVKDMEDALHYYRSVFGTVGDNAIDSVAVP
jgi:hypothetical protein